MTIQEAYQAGIDAARISSDPAQLAALPELERVREGLSHPVKRGWFAKPPEPVRGLYLWGGVGRGKSMLMDLFVDTLGIDAKRRVHFHAFMLEVDRRIAMRVNSTSIPYPTCDNYKEKSKIYNQHIASMRRG